MTRKNKIRIAVAFILVGAVATVFWPGENDAHVWVIFAGVSASDTNRVAFTITNAHPKDLRYNCEVRIPKMAGAPLVNWVSLTTNNVQTNLIISITPNHVPTNLFIPKHSALTCYATVPTTNHWRIALTRKTKGKSHAELSRLRQQLWKWAWDYGGWRLSQWVWSGETFVTQYGPEMLGNKPVDEAR
jgi:hypothetical protein